MKKIIIPDYGSGNYASIVRMVEKAGGIAEIVTNARPIADDEKIIMAGVGAFDNGMKHLSSLGWSEILSDAIIRQKIPVLGICLGMQLMCIGSDEGSLPGLGWIKAHVRHFNFPDSSPLKVPHMGWNEIIVSRSNDLFPNTQEAQRFYFTHSYFVDCQNQMDVLALCHHGNHFVASFHHDNIYGVQFHPEKSHRFGLALISNFVKKIGEG